MTGKCNDISSLTTGQIRHAANLVNLELGRNYHYSYIRDICRGIRPNNRGIQGIVARYMAAGMLDTTTLAQGVGDAPSSQNPPAGHPGVLGSTSAGGSATV